MFLSFFVIIESYYVVFGVMVISSSFDDICKELVILFVNVYDVFEVIEEYLV